MNYNLPKELHLTPEQVVDAQGRLKSFLANKEFVEVQNMDDLEGKTYKFGISGPRSGHIALIFKTPTIAEAVARILKKVDIKLEDSDKPERVKAFIPNILEFLAKAPIAAVLSVKEPEPPVQEPPMPNPVAEAQNLPEEGQKIKWTPALIVQKIKEAGFNHKKGNSCNRGAYKCFYLESRDEANAFGNILAGQIEGVVVRSKGVEVPLDKLTIGEKFGGKKADPQKGADLTKESKAPEEVVKDPEKSQIQQPLQPEAEQAPILAKTSTELFEAFVQTLRDEIRNEITLEVNSVIADLQQQNETLTANLEVANETLRELHEKNYLITKNGTPTIFFGAHEFGKSINLKDGGFVVDKTIFANQD